MKKNFKIRTIMLLIACAFVLTGCGAEKTASAVAPTTTSNETTSTPTATVVPTDTIDTTPTSAPTNEPTPTVSNTIGYVFMSDFEFPEEDRVYFEGIEKTHILPFLEEYCITEKYIDALGGNGWGQTLYEVTYVCKKDDRHTLMLVFRSSRIVENPEKIEDSLLYDSVICESMIAGEWETTSEYYSVYGLTGHIN